MSQLPHLPCTYAMSKLIEFPHSKQKTPLFKIWCHATATVTALHFCVPVQWQNFVSDASVWKDVLFGNSFIDPTPIITILLDL